MSNPTKLKLLFLSLIAVTLAGCADNPTQMNVQQQLPLNVQSNPQNK